MRNNGITVVSGGTLKVVKTEPAQGVKLVGAPGPQGPPGPPGTGSGSVDTSTLALDGGNF